MAMTMWSKFLCAQGLIRRNSTVHFIHHIISTRHITLDYIIYRFRNNKGQTALQLASQANQTSVVDWLSSSKKISDLPLAELQRVPTCGWLLSILRSYTRHKFQFRPSGDEKYSVSRSCANLNLHGLDGTLAELAEVIMGSSIDEVISHFGAISFGDTMRLKADLIKVTETLRFWPQHSRSEGRVFVSAHT